jgi:starch synthase
MFSRLAGEFPERVAVRLEFSNALAHRIEAAADMFLMPSQYEPCGLNQLYSLKYGTVPIVRATGGLADTVVDTNPQTLAKGTATGFSFGEYTSLGLSDTLYRACGAFADKPVWRQIAKTGMLQDWSWGRSAQRYVELYEQTCARSRQKVST